MGTEISANVSVHLDDDTSLEFLTDHRSIDSTTSWMFTGTEGHSMVVVNATPDQLRAFGRRLVDAANAEVLRRSDIDTEAA